MNVRSDTRGAVYAEFLIAWLPVIVFFVATWQFAELCATDLILRRAASAAARAAVVVLADDPRYYGGQPVGSYSSTVGTSGARSVDVRAAAGLVLANAPRISGYIVELNDNLTPGAPLTATITADYHCGLGWTSLVCGGGATRSISARATYAYQGANYKYE